MNPIKKVPPIVWEILIIILIAFAVSMFFPKTQQESVSITLGTNFAIATNKTGQTYLDLGVQQGPLASYAVASYLVPNAGVDSLRQALAAHSGEMAIFYAEYHPRAGGPTQLTKVSLLSSSGKEEVIWRSP